MHQSFGNTLKFRLSRSGTWLSLGPGWAALVGALSVGVVEVNLDVILQLIGLWILVDPILGTLWGLAVTQGLWRQVTQAQLPSPPSRGFNLPYAQPGSVGGGFVLLFRRYRLWWADSYWPAFGNNVTTFVVGLVLALSIGLVLSPTIFWLVVFAVSLTLLAGIKSPDLSLIGGGRLQSIVQFLIPWLMGAFLGSFLSPFSLILGGCYGVVYLGSLRMIGGHHRAEYLFYLGQIGAIFLLLALRLLPGAAVLSVLFAGQLLVRTRFPHPPDFLPRIRLYLLFGLLVAGLSLGSLLA